MATYADVDDVRPHLGSRPLTETSKPSEAEVEVWLVELEAELLGTLAAVGIETFSTRGETILGSWVSKAGVGLVRMAHAAAAGSGSNDDGKADVDAWTKRLDDIRADPVFFEQKLAGAAPSGSASLLRSHVTDNHDNLSASAFAPKITTDEVF